MGVRVLFIVAGKVMIADGREDGQLGQHVPHLPGLKELVAPGIDAMILILMPVLDLPMGNLTAIGHNIACMQHKCANITVVIVMLNHGFGDFIDGGIVVRKLGIGAGVAIGVEVELWK